jgi:hypothetical protein
MKNTNLDQQPAVAPPQTPTHYQHQLAAERESRDAAARASAVRQIDTSTGHAKPGMPELRPGVNLAWATVWPNGNPYHLILSPDDNRVNGIYELESITRGMDRVLDLPTFSEMTILYRRMPEQFQPSLYYTGDEEMFEGAMMPVTFDATPLEQRRNDKHEVRVRSIRRVFVDVDTVDYEAIIVEQREVTIDAARAVADTVSKGKALSVECSITGAEVAAVAMRLIDEAARDDEDVEPPTNEDHLMRAGIMTGICSLAMEIQSLLSSKRKAAGHE